MKKGIYIFIFLLSASLFAQMNPQTKKVTNKFFPEYEALENVTPALNKKKGFTDYEELIAFLNNLVKQHPSKIKLGYLGESQKGKKIPVVRLSNNDSTSNKIKVWMQGGLHGNEKASTEGMLYLLDRLLNDNKYKSLLNCVDLMVVPMANIDGYLKNDRYAANGLDLNRDQTKLMAPESILLKQAFSDFNPEIGLDFHEYKPFRKHYVQLGAFGVTTLQDVMFLYSGNLNVPENLRILTDTLFVENARKMLAKNNLNYDDYFSTKKEGGEIYFNQGSTNARSSATNYALTNTISTLFEIRGVGIGKTSFKRRTNNTFLSAISYLHTTNNNVDLIKNEIKKASLQENELVIKSAKTIKKGIIKLIDLDSNEIIDLNSTIMSGKESKPTLVRSRPKAYLINANRTAVIEKLKILGAKVVVLNEAAEIEVESYLVTSYKRSSVKYEKTNQQTLETKLVKKKINFPKGTFKISMQQKRSNIIAEVLEPEMANSFVSFGLIETEANKELPIYRITN